MRKVNFFFNLKPFSESLKKESIVCVKELAEKMMEYIDSIGEIVAGQRKQAWQAIDYKLVKPVIGRINHFDFWLENSGLMEIPDRILKEYIYLMELVDDSKFIDVSKTDDDKTTSSESIIIEDVVNREANIDSLIADINSTIVQTNSILSEVENLGKILEEKREQLNSRIKAQRIVQVFSPMIEDLKAKHEKIRSDGTMESFQKLINEFCAALEERNELRYRLIHGEEMIETSDRVEKSEVDNEVSNDQNINTNSTSSQNQVVDGPNNLQEKSKRYTSVVDKNAMKLFARWSLPNHHS
ncbi:hypothetical protein OJ253_25 [Cryptosporidium canis]|uniref:Uncharacterized protein n=1 Tax=Cryptosporidium canis TaxID=195482 RepID=A0A9D5I0B1_9CRYT|nr:hypothetical protein OJ253_25 [Cryptosporidium canis]